MSITNDLIIQKLESEIKRLNELIRHMEVVLDFMIETNYVPQLTETFIAIKKIINDNKKCNHGLVMREIGKKDMICRLCLKTVHKGKDGNWHASNETDN